MEKIGGKVEFLCLNCGLQGLCSAKSLDSVEEESEGLACPKCGHQLITICSFKEKASLVSFC